MTTAGVVDTEAAAAATAVRIPTATAVMSATTTDGTKTAAAKSVAARTALARTAVVRTAVVRTAAAVAVVAVVVAAAAGMSAATVRSDATMIEVMAATTIVVTSDVTAKRVTDATDMPVARTGTATVLAAVPLAATSVAIAMSVEASEMLPDPESLPPALLLAVLPGMASPLLDPRRATRMEVRATTKCCISSTR